MNNNIWDGIMANKIYRIAICGGPCSGKSSGMAYLSDKLTEKGFRVLTVPEIATILFTSGYSINPDSVDSIVQFQSSLISLQIAFEQHFLKLAQQSDEPTIILMDRGAMDSKAYTPCNLWQALLDENAWSEVGLRDKHYDAVIHMVTAANGAEQYYTLANNLARTETPEQARIVDKKLQDAWVGHSHFRIIDNSTNFEGKLKRVLHEICHVIGLPLPMEIERKYLVEYTTIPVHAKELEIEQVYLTCESGEARVRRRGVNGAYVYTHTAKTKAVNGKRVEVERQISSREYLNLLKQANPEKLPIKKKRTCFLWDNQYFELDVFDNHFKGQAILEVELSDENQKVELPPFIKVIADVTDDVKYTNSSLAQKV